MASSIACYATPRTSMTLNGSDGSASFKPKLTYPSPPLQVKLNAHKLNGNRVIHIEAPSANAEPLVTLGGNWKELLTAMTVKEQLGLLDLVPEHVVPSALSGVVMEGLIVKQSFPIRSYEVGADQKASIETVLRHLQEISLNHVRAIGLLADGFGATPEMNKRDLIWVFTKMRVIVEKYPTWGDVVEVESWVNAHGKNGLSRDWHVRDSFTGQTIARATGVLVMMNKNTRRLSKMPEEVRDEIQWIFVEREHVIVQDNNERVLKLDVDSADFLREGLVPQWSDLDANQHVNNVKYISWILESAPLSLIETYELCGMTLEYRRECHMDSKLKSFTTISGDCTGHAIVVCNHLLLLEDGTEILRGGTEWRPKKTPLSP